MTARAPQDGLERRRGALAPALRAQIEALAARVRQYDGIESLSEAPLLALAAGDPGQRHWLAWQDGRLAGYAQREAGGSAAELAVDPDWRGRGLGLALARALAQDSPEARLWAHGDLGAARHVAAALRLAPVRELWELRSQRRARPAGRAGAGIRIRAFDPGRDRSAWVALNAAAFASHPEQGRLTLADLEQRMAQPWFDPAGLLVAEQNQTARLAGYVWTKIEANAGEIYGIGVDPAAQGRGLGSALLEAGLRHLESRGIGEVRLFVEADNAPAIAAYRRQGFKLVRRDVQYGFQTPAATA
ncbi:MAG: mycothiol synthase [Bifidobacteriaceae bacterium]|jgi:mycothiol synthase|nr:mycothiol synthase [Bifidobacteriaceae bacterium]